MCHTGSSAVLPTLATKFSCDNAICYGLQSKFMHAPRFLQPPLKVASPLLLALPGRVQVFSPRSGRPQEKSRIPSVNVSTNIVLSQALRDVVETVE